jgi:putative addiction module component (TIGR02574 family)
MAIPVHELEAEALNLPPADRARLLERLIESFDRDSKVEEAWLDEALRREQDVLSGKVKLVPGNAAVARVKPTLDTHL